MTAKGRFNPVFGPEIVRFAAAKPSDGFSVLAFS